MRVGSLFSGIGGMDIAAERASMEVVWQSENDKHASTVLEHHWPSLNLGDIHDITLDQDTLRRIAASAVDVLCGGFPCTDYSVAGRREGLAGDAGGLWWQFHRLIGEGRPTWVVAENVPGLLSSRCGEDFATIIDSLTEYGYGVVWGVLDAQWFGVAQRRRRVFIVAHSGGQPRPEILALSEGVFGHPEPSRETREAVAASLETVPTPDRLRAEEGHIVYRQQRTTDYVEDQIASTVAARDYKDATDLIAFAQNQRDEVRDLNDVAGALAAEPGIKQQTYLAVAATLTQGAPSAGRRNEDDVNLVTAPQVRRLTPLECARLQGFPGDFYDGIAMSDTQKYRQMGNAVAVPVVEWIMKRIAET